MDRIIEHLPHWLAWPVNLLSTAAALAGAGLVLYGAGFGDGRLTYFGWGAGAFAAAGLLWWLSDLASSNRPL
jgi:hypothetical protein